MGYKSFFVILFSMIFLAGCVSRSPESAAIENCELLCKNSKMNLSRGPCLSDYYEWNVTDWVCDIAHNPRTQEDNDVQNQCKQFLNGNAHHFVELTPDCKFIRAR